MASNTQTSGGKLASGGTTKKVTTYAGSSGNDWISSGASTIWGDGQSATKFGNDVIYGTSAVQTIYAQGGNDWVNGGGGSVSNGSGGYLSDTMDGGAGIDWVSFQPNAANGDAYAAGVTIDLGAGTYSFNTGGSGGVVAHGAAVNFENVWGSQAADQITGSNGANDVHGGDGGDTISGLAGNDELEGQAGQDTIDGGEGADKIEGGACDDDLTGGAGNDTFVFEASHEANGTDTITDLALCNGGSGGDVDVLDLTRALSGVTFGGSGGADINDYVQIVETGSGGSDLFVDMDGAGSGGSVVWAHLDGVASGDEVHVNAGSFNDCLTATGGGSGGGFISVSGWEINHGAGSGFSGVWFDTDKDGVFDSGETELFVGSGGTIYTDAGLTIAVDFTDGAWKVEFWDVLGPTVDLTGFASGDEAIINMAEHSGYLGTPASHTAGLFMGLTLGFEGPAYSTSASGAHIIYEGLAQHRLLAVADSAWLVYAYGPNAFPTGGGTFATNFSNAATLSFVMPDYGG